MQDPKFQEMIARLRAAKNIPALQELRPTSPTQSEDTIIYDKYGNLISLNANQQAFAKIAASGQSAVLIGPAGTGKTTTQKAVVQALFQAGRIPPVQNSDHKYIQSGAPGIVICAFTKIATNNIRRNMPKDLQDSCITIHKVLEYQPVVYEILDENTGNLKKSMKFEATRNSRNPLPSSIKVIVFEEASMIGTPLHEEVMDACQHDVQFIYLGDIQQLPPVMGSAILGYKMNELPVIELTEVYRQALESPIISLAHRILSGVPIPPEEFPKWHFPGKLKIHPWKKKIHKDQAVQQAGLFFVKALEAGEYSPEDDMILCPFNVAFGTIELNKIIANFLAKDKETFEVIAGRSKHYFSVGDKVLVDKEAATIISIHRNGAYHGTKTKPSSVTLDYWGNDSQVQKSEEEDPFLLLEQQFAAADEDRTHAASHIITCLKTDAEQEVTLDTAKEINDLILGYAITVHKSQGSEYKRVFLTLHDSHNMMLSRELLYTAVTRARESLYIICDPAQMTLGIERQKYPGRTWQEKAEYFKGKVATATP